MVDRYAELYRAFRWNVPARYNMAHACCGQWADDRNRFALYWEDESGACAKPSRYARSASSKSPEDHSASP